MIRTMAESATSLTLVTISFSHFCERGRWALDLTGLPYKEVRSLPLIHMPVVAWWQFWAGTHRAARADKLDRVNSKFSTPLLLGQSKGTGAWPGNHQKWVLQLTDSSDIVQFVSSNLESTKSASLYPTDASSAAAVRDFEASLCIGLGPSVRAFVYHYVISTPEVFRDLGARNSSGLTAALWSLLYPLIGAGIRRGLVVTASRAERSRVKIVEAFADASRRLQASDARLCVCSVIPGTLFNLLCLPFLGLCIRFWRASK